jgi:hypothetical protein
MAVIYLTFDVESILGLLHHVAVGNVADDI